MIGRLARKLRAASDVVAAALEVARARRRVSRRPVGALVEKSAELPRSGQAALPQATIHQADRWGAAVDRALRVLPGDSACLVRASALHALLSRRGLPAARVRIGVRRSDAGFEAHAWVELDGTPLAEPHPLRGAFSSLEGVTLR